MIFNYCIYGEVLGGYTGDITLTYYDNTITEILTKTYNVTDSTYQFHLGDSDMLTMNHVLKHGSSIVLTIDGVYFDNIVLELGKFVHKHDIDINTTPDYTNNIISGTYDIKRVVSDKYYLEEEDLNLYSYFSVVKDDELIYESNFIFDWIPKEDGTYTITQRGYNRSNNIVNEKVTTLDILENYTEVESIDYIFYTKRNKILKIELPSYVKETLVLEDGWYFEGEILYGKINNLLGVNLMYSRGYVRIKPQIGDIIDY
jgi:hypothetical protein